MDEKYDLKWKTFNEHLLGVFKELGEEGHFADVMIKFKLKHTRWCSVPAVQC